MLLAEIYEFLLTSRIYGLENHKAFYLLAVNGVGDADDPGFQHLRMPVKNIFNFFGVDVFTATDDKVLLSLGEINVAVFVGVADISRVEPSVPNGGRGLLGLVPVALHNPGSFDNYLAYFAGRQLLIVLVEYLNRIAFLITFADGTVLGRSFSGYITAVDGGGFTQPVAFPDVDAISLFPPASYLQRHGRRAADARSA